VTSILYLITDLDVGGAERALLELVGRLDRTRFRPTVCSLASDGSLAKEFSDLGVPVVHLGMDRLWQIPHALRLLRLLRGGRFDILHTFLFHANVLGRVLGRIAGVPVVLSGIRVAEPRWWHLLLERWTAPLADMLVAVSDGVRRHMIQRAGIPPDRIVTIPNGVDLERFEVPRGRFRSAEGISESRLVVSMVGRLDEQKGLTFLLRAVPRVVADHPEARFYFVGEGPEKGALQRLCRELEIEQFVRFLGFRSDVPSVLRDSDVFVLPSLWEGLANAMLEAMAAGLPVVVTDVEGVRDVVTDGETGLVVAPADPVALAHALGHLLRDPGLRGRLGRAGRGRVAEEFRWGKVVEDTVVLYRKMRSQKGLEPPPEGRQDLPVGP
jgi:starch synthase (maltosyl-transferring)